MILTTSSIIMPSFRSSSFLALSDAFSHRMVGADVLAGESLSMGYPVSDTRFMANSFLLVQQSKGHPRVVAYAND